jgi:predicted transcriptional regulator
VVYERLEKLPGVVQEMTAEEFSRLIDRTGLKQSKIAELCGVKKQTISTYTTGRRAIPKLVAEKIKQLDQLING